MSTAAQYASNPTIGFGTTTTADTSYTQPTNSTVGVIFTATGTGGRVDEIANITTGTSVAGILRIWECQGTMGATVSSMTASTTTITVTTGSAHGLTTGNLITVQNAFPLDYNATNVAVTVTSATTFTYTVTTAPTIATATTIGVYSSTPATAVYTLIKEIPIQAITGSTTVPAWQASINSALNADIMPRILQAGWSIRTTVSVTQTNGVRTTATGGQFT